MDYPTTPRGPPSLPDNDHSPFKPLPSLEAQLEAEIEAKAEQSPQKYLATEFVLAEEQPRQRGVKRTAEGAFLESFVIRPGNKLPRVDAAAPKTPAKPRPPTERKAPAQHRVKRRCVYAGLLQPVDEEEHTIYCSELPLIIQSPDEPRYVLDVYYSPFMTVRARNKLFHEAIRQSKEIWRQHITVKAR